MEKTTPLTTTTTTTNSLDQTHDFMNVDSFSQLPFIRPAPTTTKTSLSTSLAAPIRLFGIDFSSSSTTATDNSDSGDSNNLDSSKDTNINTSSNNRETLSSSESSRKFECHYCCRNFPTSQALGGHQNAHKRERQHAKRAHLQSAMLTTVDPTSHPHHFYSSLANNNYPHAHAHLNRTLGNSYYPSTSLSSTPMYSYHHHHNHQQPHHPPTINGSPLAMWRIPTTVHSHTSHHHSYASAMHRDRSLHPLPLLAGSHSPSFSSIDASASKGSANMNMNMNTNMNINMSMNSSHQNQVRRGNGDQVSLDLHL